MMPAVALAFALALAAGSTQAAEPSLASVARFNFDIGYTILDGNELPMVILRSRQISFSTDSVRTWRPLEEPLGSAGFSFQRELDSAATLDISLLVPEWARDTNATWEQFVATIKNRLGEGTTLSGRLDSAEGPPALSLFGWRTREIVFTPPAGAPVQHHVLATDGKTALHFVLRCPAARLAQYSEEFRQFLAHLTIQ